MPCDVYIERAREPGAEDELARAVGAAFGLPAEKLAARIREGSVRVKSGADRAVAKRLAAELEQMGAVCRLVPAGGGAGASAPPPVPAGASRPPPPPRKPPPRPGPAGGEAPGGRALAAVDGSSERPAAAASAGEAPADPFAPPEMQAPPEDLDLADESTVPEAEPEPPAAPEPAAEPVAGSPPARAPGARLRWQDRARAAWAGAIESSRGQFVAGAAAAALLGLVAAYAVGAIGEAGYADSLERVSARAGEVTDLASWRELERARAEELDAVRGRRAGILATSGLAWLAVAGVVAFAWFRIVRSRRPARAARVGR